MQNYRNDPDYTTGFNDGWSGVAPRSSGRAYLLGHATASATRSVLTGEAGADQVPDISFHVRLPISAHVAA